MLERISKSNFFIKALMTALAVLFVGASMGIMSFANVGAEPITFFAQSLSRSFKITQGAAVYINNAVLLLLVLVFNTSKLNGATIISFLVTGKAMDITLRLLELIFTQDLSLIARHAMNVMGALMLGFFIGIYLSFDFGASPADGVMILISKITGLSYKYSIWIFNAIYVLLGIIFGGNFGLGTIIASVLMGISCDFVNKHSSKKQC
ncbi:MAG: hypothetical protein RSD35_07645 [Oscillospiraceae bacterium]